jgi:hypothetical protein
MALGTAGELVLVEPIPDAIPAGEAKTKAIVK